MCWFFIKKSWQNFLTINYSRSLTLRYLKSSKSKSKIKTIILRGRNSNWRHIKSKETDEGWKNEQIIVILEWSIELKHGNKLGM